MPSESQTQWRQFGFSAAIAVLAAAATAGGFYALMQSGVLAPRQDAQADRTPAPAAGAVQAMKLEAQFAGPLKDTVIQRWQDPATGTVCYLYLPIVVQHSPPTPTGFVQYGANHIGSISCLPH